MFQVKFKGALHTLPTNPLQNRKANIGDGFTATDLPSGVGGHRLQCQRCSLADW